MIHGHCFTNLDERFQWPTLFVAVPRIGDRVQSLCGRRILKVHSIIHSVTNIKDWSGMETQSEPRIGVELNK